ncbi:collagenase [Jeotgalibacillus marinus]|uniref:microbial collagenase n=1 Tax=Jeotgalibacillus marinus TaxID=86667 RepID=A0ABV3Q603_9BACL
MTSKNKKVFKTVGNSLLAVTLLVPVGYTTYAQETSNEKYDQLIESTFDQKQSLLQNEQTVHVKNEEELQRIRPEGPKDEDNTSDQKFENEAVNDYTFADLNRLSNADLVDLLVTINTRDISDFWSYSRDVVEFYGDQQRILYLLDEINDLGSQYTANDGRGLATLMEVVNKGFLFEFDYQDPKMAYLSDLSFREKVTPAVVSVIKNSHFGLGTTAQDAVVEHAGFLTTHATVDLELFDNALPVLEEFNSQVDTYITEITKTNAIYGLINGLEYVQYYNYRNGPYDFVEEAPWYGQIDDIFNEVAVILEFSQFADTRHEWLIDNAVFFITEEGKFHSDLTFTLDTFNKALNTYPYYGGVYLGLARTIDRLGGDIDYDQIVEDYEDYYYGNEYTFDNGEIVIKAGDRVDPEEIQRLYWAAKEEKAQFHRYYGVDEPIEQGNVDDVLTAIIYNDRDEYNMNQHLNNVSTNNGGIYIQPWGTLFTWDRDVAAGDSIYELEELFRHEYFHYLQSRYAIPGMWGRTPLYDNDRLVWIEEGGGEFFAGATRTGFDTRSTKIRGIHSNPQDRYTLDEVLHGTYGSWYIYDYAYAFYDFIVTKHVDVFDQVKVLLRTEDAAGFDQYMDELSSDPVLEEEFQEHMQELVDDGGRVVLVEDDYTASHSARDFVDIKEGILNEMRLRRVSDTENSAEFFNTYTVEGTYVGGKSNGLTDDREEMNDIVNQALANLDSTWSGYKTVTAYFVNHRVNDDGRYEFDVVFHGLLTDDKDS